MAKMKTPKKKEVVKYFENAKEVESLAGTRFKFNPSEKIVERSGVFRYEPKGTSLILWNPTEGYAKILSYKEPKKETYKITKEQICKLFNTYGNDKNDLLQKYFPEVFETKLEVGKWYKYKTNYFNWIMCYTGIDGKNYGFNTSGTFGTDFEMDLKTEWKEATEKEVTEALTKEAVRIGYNTDKPTHFNYKNGTGYLQNPSKSDFLFRDGILYLWDIKIFEDGQWAEIIPSLTIKEAEAKLKCKII